MSFALLREIAELHKANVMKASHAHEEKLSSELQAKQQLQIQLDRQLIQAKQEQEGLLNQVRYSSLVSLSAVLVEIHFVFENL